jgi:hypothetical protein
MTPEEEEQFHNKCRAVTATLERFFSEAELTNAQVSYCCCHALARVASCQPEPIKAIRTQFKFIKQLCDKMRREDKTTKH